MPSNSWLNDWITGDVPTAGEFRKGMGCVFDTTLGVATATIDTGAVLPTTYAHLRVIFQARGDTAATTVQCTARVNNDSGANYDFEYFTSQEAVATPAAIGGNTSLSAVFVPGATATANYAGIIVIDIPNYGGTTFFKNVSTTNGYLATAATVRTFVHTEGFWRSTAAINRIAIATTAGNFVIGSRLSVYVMGS